MRLISWDGRRDVSYENCHLVINPKTFEIEAITGNKDFEPVMGIYSTEAKALKVMEMLREQYQYGKKIAVPKLEENGIAKDDDVMLFNTRLINDFFKGGTYLPVKVFKFPDDSEVEV